MRSLRQRVLTVPLLAAAAAAPASAQCDRLLGCELVWEDTFDGTSVDAGRWEAQTGDGTAYGLPAGWGNNELQSYQAQNAVVEDGVLKIVARRETAGGASYTSARLRTRGRGDWTYGRMEMRARLPTGRGLWPAFWMLPTDPSIYGTWAASGEIDIMELVGSEPDRVTGTLHYGGAWPNNQFSSSEYRLGSGSFHDDFHRFAVEWEPGEIRWYVDGERFATRTEWSSTGGPFPAPFDVDFHLLLNVAVGGNLPGAPDATTVFPQEMVVDWVRVYQAPPLKGAEIGATGLIFDKPLKMKRIEASVYLPFQNQALRNDRPGDPRRLACSVATVGRKAPLPPDGRLRLQLLGEQPAGGDLLRRWTSSSLTAPLSGGSARFDAEEIERLVAEAAGRNAAIRFFQVTFEGGKGKKVAELTLDCLQLPG